MLPDLLDVHIEHNKLDLCTVALQLVSRLEGIGKVDKN